MPTLAAGRVVSILWPTDGQITITPGSAGRVSLNARGRDGSQSIAPREIYNAETITVSAGDTVILEAINTDATYTSPVSGDGTIGGVTVTGTPTPGQVPTATSGTEATWQTPSGGAADAVDVAALLADTTLTYATTSAGTILRTREEGFSYEVAASGAGDHHETTAGGLKLYWLPQQIATPEIGRATSALDIAHYSRQGLAPVSSPSMIVGHDYTDASRTLQLDKVGGSIGAGSYVLGLRRASNHIRRDDQPGRYVSGAGFLRCSYDQFTQSAAFTGEIAGNVLTVSAVSSGALAAGQFVTWSGTDNGTTISAQTSGTTGGVGTYTVAVRGSTSAAQTVASQAMTADTKSEVLTWYLGTTGDMGWAVDRAQFSTGYSGGFAAYTFAAANQTGVIAAFNSSNGGVLNIADNVTGLRTDLIAPSNQTSGLRLEAAGGGIDIAPSNGVITARGNINSQSGSNMTITAVAAQLSLNGTNGVRSLVPFQPGLYTVATLPAAASFANYLAMCTNGDAGAPCLAYSNGTSWLRIPLGAAVSAT